MCPNKLKKNIKIDQAASPKIKILKIDKAVCPNK